jgi:hypothetical protein
MELGKAGNPVPAHLLSNMKRVHFGGVAIDNAQLLDVRPCLFVAKYVVVEQALIGDDQADTRKSHSREGDRSQRSKSPFAKAKEVESDPADGPDH